MAHNLHIVYSDTFKGAGLVAGGSYHAESYYPFAGVGTSVFNPYDRDAEWLAKKGSEDAKENAEDELIDSVSNLNNAPVYIQ